MTDQAQFRKINVQYTPPAESFPDPEDKPFMFWPKRLEPVPITDAHEFRRRLNACSQPGGSLHFFQMCTRPCSSSKKLRQVFLDHEAELDENEPKQEELWSIRARERRSFFRIFMYNMLCLTPCVASLSVWPFARNRVR